MLVIPDEDSSVTSEPVAEEEGYPVLVISSPSSSLETVDSEDQLSEAAGDNVSDI